MARGIRRAYTTIGPKIKPFNSCIAVFIGGPYGHINNENGLFFQLLCMHSILQQV